ncbi:MAG: phosphoenolpyruvate carboxykinase (ATP), partial [Rubricoccaceae bacterium]|nr:phosphoenolpyruvate carboxykinase (ATP) [Rubricoccaceae bacterium]
MNAPDAVLRDLAALGLTDTGNVYYNLTPAELYEHAIRNGEGLLTKFGPLATRTDPHTGRSPNDRFVVKESSSESHVGWGSTNKPVSSALFDRLLEGMGAHAKGREIFVRDCYAGADPRYRMKVRVITEKAWHSIFAYNM